MRDIKGAEALAKDPATPPALLEQLSRKSQKLARLIAKNPNITTETLFRLGAQFPKEFLQNPMLSMLSLEDPQFWGTLTPGLMLALLRIPTAPIEKVSAALLSRKDALYLSTKLELYLASHPKTDVDLLIALAGSFNSEVRQKAARHPRLPSALAKIAGAEQWSHQHREHLVTRKPPLLNADFVRLTDEDLSFAARQWEWFRRTIAQLDCTPPKTLQSLLLDNSSVVVRHAAENRKTPLEDLRGLLTNTNFFAYLARNHASDAEMLAFIWENQDLFLKAHRENIQEELGQNPNTPIEILLELLDKNLGFDSRQLKVLYALAQNPALPPASLREIYDHAPTLQSLIIENESCPFDLLLSHDSPYDQIKNPNLPEDLAFALMKRAPVARAFLEKKRRAALSQPLLLWLSAHEDHEVRCLIAGHPDMPEAAVDALSRDKSYLVRAAVAERHKLPDELRRRLQKDQSKLVRRLSNTTS